MNSISNNLQPVVSGLWIYPVKSCKGISLEEMEIVNTGPKFDRQFMIVDQNNNFLTLRSHSKLSQIQTSIIDNTLLLDFAKNTIKISLFTPSEQIEKIKIFNDEFMAGVESDEVNSKLSDFLSEKVKLVRFQSESHRDLGDGKNKFSQQTMFADGRPLLLTNLNSLKDLNQKLNQNNEPASDIRRFRSNVIINNLPSYAEEKIKSVKIGDVFFQNPKLCSRCPVITKDYETGEVVSKKSLILIPRHETAKGPRMMFGINLSPLNVGKIKLNDLVEIEY